METVLIPERLFYRFPPMNPASARHSAEVGGPWYMHNLMDGRAYSRSLATRPSRPRRDRQGSATQRQNNMGTRHHEVDYVQPVEVICSDNSPVLSEAAGPVVVKTNWPREICRGSEAAMYRASNGQFGTIPQVYSYEGVGECRETISNILLLPRDEDIAECHSPFFSDDVPPEKPELRTLWFTVFGTEGQSLVEATSPRQLSRAWVHFVLGASVGALRPTP